MHCKKKTGDRGPQIKTRTYEGNTTCVITRNTPSLYVPARHQQCCPRGLVIYYQSLLEKFSGDSHIYNL